MFYVNHMRTRMSIPKYAEKSGNPIHITNSLKRHFRKMSLLGESVQDGIPTPDAPVNIVSIENPVMTVLGKNLFDINTVTFIGNGNNLYYWKGDNDISIAYPVSFDSRLVFANIEDCLMLDKGTYTLSCDLKVNNTLDNYKTVAVAVRNMNTDKYISDKWFELNTMNLWERHNFTFTVTERTPINFRFQPYSPPNPGAYACRVYIRNIQVEKSAVATEYEPYTAQTVILDGITIRAIEVPSTYTNPTYAKNGKFYVADKIYIQGGKVYKQQNIDRIVYDGSSDEWWSLYRNNTNTIRFSIPQDKGMTGYINPDRHSYNSQFEKNWSVIADEEGWAWGDNSARYYVGINKSRLSSVDDAGFRTWLSQNPMTVDYILLNPIITDITSTPTGQALLSLYTNRGTTNIFLNSTPGTISVKYVRK